MPPPCPGSLLSFMCALDVSLFPLPLRQSLLLFSSRDLPFEQVKGEERDAKERRLDGHARLDALEERGGALLGDCAAEAVTDVFVRRARDLQARLDDVARRDGARGERARHRARAEEAEQRIVAIESRLEIGEERKKDY